MRPLICRRALLRGLFAMPAVVAASSLMPLRGELLNHTLPMDGGFRLSNELAQDLCRQMFELTKMGMRRSAELRSLFEA